ncbi:cytochrome c peroxidase [Dyella sp. C11]|uniref:cytochrome-c peroxidase n=1 Tax=Dyella sp. C11 TaxID=2126991 RepID=UPI0013009FF4|nr:cytochrome c peroxidase [Dyella sp. C11]
MQGPFFDKNLSADGAHSCASCHMPSQAWSSDQLSVGKLTRAVPSLYGAADKQYFFWDGRAASLEAQVMEVLENPAEMNSSRLLVARYALDNGRPIASCRPTTHGLADELTSLAPSQLTASESRRLYLGLDLESRSEVDKSFACVAHLIADYVRSIPIPRTVWTSAPKRKNDIDPSVWRGAVVFAGKGRCATCHYGQSFSDGQFHNIGIANVNEVDISDPGRFSAVQSMRQNEYNLLAKTYYPSRVAETEFNVSEEMWGAFKTPSLIGLSKRHKFMHNGRFGSIGEVVDYYDTLKLAVVPTHHYVGLLSPLNLSQEERADLIAFLNSL